MACGPSRALLCVGAEHPGGAHATPWSLHRRCTIICRLFPRWSLGYTGATLRKPLGAEPARGPAFSTRSSQDRHNSQGNVGQRQCSRTAKASTLLSKWRCPTACSQSRRRRNPRIHACDSRRGTNETRTAINHNFCMLERGQYAGLPAGCNCSGKHGHAMGLSAEPALMLVS